MAVRLGVRLTVHFVYSQQYSLLCVVVSESVHSVYAYIVGVRAPRQTETVSDVVNSGNFDTNSTYIRTRY